MADWIYPLGLGEGSFGDGVSSAGWQPQNFLYGSQIVVPSAGTVSQLAVRGRASSDTVNLKLGLYTSAGALVAQATGSSTSSDYSWRNSTTFSASVSAGTYYVMVSAAVAGMEYTYSAAGNGSYATEAYATAMQPTETFSAESGLLYGVRLMFEASAGNVARVLGGPLAGAFSTH